MPSKPYHMVKIDKDVYEHITESGKYNESFSGILRRLLKIGS